MLTIEQFEPEDVLDLTPREPDKTQTASVNLMERSRLYRQMGPCFTGFWNTVPVVCAGIIVLWPGLGEGWAYTSGWVWDHPVTFYRNFKRVMEHAAKEANLARLQVSVAENHFVSRLWLLRMGYQEEGLMRKYGPEGADYVRMARIF